VESRISALEQRIEQQAAEIERLSAAVHRQRRPRLPGGRRAMAIGLVGLMLASAPAVALASHLFTDVPTSHTFHGDIGRLAEAGITAGCSPTTYCPEDFVTRGQMAAFLARTGGRAGFDASAPNVSLDAPTVLASVTIRPGNVQGGTAFVLLVASYGIYSQSATGLPISVDLRIRNAADPFADLPGSATGFAQVDALDSIVGQDGGSIVTVVPVPSGVPITFELASQKKFADGTVFGRGSLAAVYLPFSEDGDDVLNQ
jgi:hypothetical protein